MICMAHAAFVIYRGNLPRAVAVLSGLTMLVNLSLYMDFAGDQARLGRRPPAEKEPNRLTFRFDSSGWFYVYHFGVALWLQEHIMPEGLTAEECETSKYPKSVAFAGSSGGALVGGTMASGINSRDLFEFVLKLQPQYKHRPWKIFEAVEKALKIFLPKNAPTTLTGRLRVLVTRVWWKFPFCTGEVVDQFDSWEDCFHMLRASCHVPGLQIFPYSHRGRHYYDGLVWPSLFVPWSGDDAKLVVKVSAVSTPMSDIRAPMSPLWWTLLPPEADVLRGLFWTGYRDTALWFADTEKAGMCGCRAEGSRARARSRTQSLVGRTKSNSDGDMDLSPPSSPAGAKSSKAAAIPSSPTTPSPPSPSNGKAEEDSTGEQRRTRARSAKHEMARKLLIKEPRPLDQMLPECDPHTGQNVQELMEKYRKAADANFRWATKVIVGVALAGTVIGWCVALAWA